ncbi:TlpA family protein disulfide reductase [Bacteroides sp.]
MRFLKKLTFVSFLFLFGMCIQDDPEVFSLKPGDSLPEFSVQDNYGNIVSTETLRDKVGVIAFIHTGCPDCRQELPELEKAYQQFSSNEAIQFIAISRAQGYESLTEYWENNELTLPYSAQDDDSVYKKFASQNIPRIYIASPNGIIIFTSDDSAVVTAEMLAEQINKVFTTEYAEVTE